MLTITLVIGGVNGKQVGRVRLVIVSRATEIN